VLAESNDGAVLSSAQVFLPAFLDCSGSSQVAAAQNSTMMVGAFRLSSSPIVR
jgi:hypothetical protein